MLNTAVVLQAEGLAKSYGKHQALSDLTFDLRAGEILGLLGPNGAGKTTAIRILTTVLPASRGHYSILGIPDSEPERIRAVIGAAPENGGFPGGVAGVDFLVHMGRLYGYSKADAKARATNLLQRFGLPEVAGKPIATYSRGMKQRLALARSFVNEPKVLFLDEPTLGLDPRGQRDMLLAVRDAAEDSQVAVVLSSHLLEVVETLCHSALILDRGQVVSQGSMSDVKRQVSVPIACRLRTKTEAIERALSALSSMGGVTAEVSTRNVDELVISLAPSLDGGDPNAVLRHLLQAQVPIESFDRQGARLDDAFLSITQSPRA